MSGLRAFITRLGGTSRSRLAAAIVCVACLVVLATAVTMPWRHAVERTPKSSLQVSDRTPVTPPVEPEGIQDEAKRTDEEQNRVATPRPATAPLQTERRVALVIGNAAYKAAGISLFNPVNDAQDISAVLTALGFEVVTALDAGKPDMDQALQRFARLAGKADSALFFYAGHALQLQGQNFLMPTDAELEDEVGVRYQTVSLEDVRAALDRTSGVKIMIIDACRNNPLANRLKQTIAGTSRSVSATRGLARIDKAQGMVVAYATAADEVAQDGRGRNSPFTTALLKRLQEPGLEIEMMFRRVASDVNAQTGGRQRPETHISLLSEYYLNQSDRLDWERIKDRDDAAALRDHIAKYPSAPSAITARNRLDALQRLQAEPKRLEPSNSQEASQRQEATQRQEALRPQTDPQWQLAAKSPELPAPPPVTIPKPLPGPVFGEAFRDCPDCPELVAVPSGEFMMGSAKQDIASGIAAANEGPQHRVGIGRPLAIGRFEVTREQFERFVQASGYTIGDHCFTLEENTPKERADRSFRNPGYAQGGTHPAVCINWADAKAYVAWLSQTTGKAYRLLSEAEWEYAARAGGALGEHDAKDPAAACKVANGADQSAQQAQLLRDYTYMDCTDGYAHTAPVGSFKANAFGLFDLIGNVWEWTEDCFADSYAGAPADGAAYAQAVCPARTVRGGSWFGTAESLGPAFRAKAAANARYDDIGFRIARVLTP